MRAKHVATLIDLHEKMSGLLDELTAEHEASVASRETVTGPVDGPMAAAMETAKGLPPGSVIPIGTSNVKPGRTDRAPAPSHAPPAAAAAPAVDGAAVTSPIVGVCNATRGCGTLIADDNRDASGALVCPRCTHRQT